MPFLIRTKSDSGRTSPFESRAHFIFTLTKLNFESPGYLITPPQPMITEVQSVVQSSTWTKKIVLQTPEDDDRQVYISGNFNHWTTQDFRFKMDKIEPGRYEFNFPESPEFKGELIYKFTKGDWSEVEIDKNGNRTPNRHWHDDNPIRKEKVAKWRKNWLPYRPSQLPQIRL